MSKNKLDKLSADQLIEALRNSEFSPKHKIIEHRLEATQTESKFKPTVYVYSVTWDDVDDYTDLLISCDTLFITEYNDTLYADI